MTGRLRIAIPLFPRFTALDAIGPYEVLQCIPAFDITFVGHARGEVRADNGMLGLVIDATFEEPGGPRRDRLPRRGGHAPAAVRRAGTGLAAGRARQPISQT
jgi:hypothetical protein